MSPIEQKIISDAMQSLSSINITGDENIIEQFHKQEQYVEVFRKMYKDAYNEGKKNIEKININSSN